MLKEIKLIRAWTRTVEGDDGTEKTVTHEAEKLLKVDTSTAQALIDGGIAKAWGPEERAEEGRQEAARLAELQTAAKAAVKTAISELSGDAKAQDEFKAALGIRVTKDAYEDSPTYGYEDGDTVTAAGFGSFLADVYARGVSADNATPKRLKMAMDKRREALAHAVEKGHVRKDNAFGGQNVTIDTEGGYAVPPGYAAMIVQTNVENDWIRPRATTVAIGTKTLEFPLAVDYDHSNDTIHGGAIAYWKGEEQALDLSKVTFDARKMELNKLTALGKVTHEFMQFADGVSIGSFLIPIFQEAIRFKEQCGFLFGSGSGMPLGLSSGLSKITVAKKSGQGAKTIVLENLFEMLARFRANVGGNAVWIHHKSIYPQLQGLTLGSEPVYLPGNSIAGRPHATLFGIPMLSTEYAKLIGTEGDLYLADLSSYMVADHTRGPEIARSIHVEFDKANEWFRIIRYVDGQPLWSKPFTDKQGYQTAPLVTLETRA